MKTTERVLVMNIQGASHAKDYVYRMRLFSRLLAFRRWPNLLLLSECQPPQQKLLPSRYAYFAGKGGWSDVVAWKRHLYDVVSERTYRIPYLDGAHNVPYVLLRHKKTGRYIWLFPVHLPPTMDGYDQEDRRVGARILFEAVATALESFDAPVLIGGDFNDHFIQDWIRRNVSDEIQKRLTLGVVDKRRNIDYLFGVGVVWKKTAVLWTRRVRRITDHAGLLVKFRF